MDSHLFESTGVLEKDYSAYCEIINRQERDEILDGIFFEDKPFGPDGTNKVTTNVFIRDLEWCLHKHDMRPLANAIPHCQNLFRVRFTSAGVTETSFKLLVQAVWRSPSVMSVWLDFNPSGLYPDPKPWKAAPKAGSPLGKSTSSSMFLGPDEEDDDDKEYHLYVSEARGAALAKEVEQLEGKKLDPLKAKAAKEVKKVEKKGDHPDEESEKGIPVPASLHALLLTQLQDISVRGNDINDAQLEPFCQLLETNAHLLSLNLWGNEITDIGAKKVASALRSNFKLTSLNLGNNKIGDAGLAAFADCFKPVIVDNIEFFAIRGRVRAANESHVPEELPVYPVLEDLLKAKLEAAASDGTTGSARDKKNSIKPGQQPKQGKKGNVQDPTSRPPSLFDHEVVRLTEGDAVAGIPYIVPGNSTLWSLNLANNKYVTPKAFRGFMLLFEPQEWELLPTHVPPGSIPVTPRDSESDKPEKKGDKKPKGKAGRKPSSNPRSPRQHTATQQQDKADSGGGDDTPLGTPTAQQPVPKMTAVLSVFHPSPFFHGIHTAGLERLMLANAAVRKTQQMEQVETMFQAWLAKKAQAREAEAKAKEEEQQAPPKK
eukprot:TRINITY_DN53936_c0_g1_i1.p1 TRINITY_DN53936_c0_g1~~TRINITY_DN53936_c0_g1_i1.p1  ORF type:complete len:600 (+),score=72.30 TRINITY_DN53936_c0_g1_i1:41-1840(+)